ncbi:nucleolar complex protein 4 homolog isoform 2-T2 [Pholidichthys leucotaenia]
MAPTKRRNVSLLTTREKRAKVDAGVMVEELLESRRNSNRVYDVLERLQSESEQDVIGAVDGCAKLFTTLMERGEIYVGKVPAEEEEEVMKGDISAEEKYRIFLRHRYSSCVEILLELLNHQMYSVRESALCCLMKFTAAEGRHPVQDVDVSEHHSFPRHLIKAVVDQLLSLSSENSLLISRFQEFLDIDDVRFYVMSSVRENVGHVMDQNKGTVLPVYQNNVFSLLSSISLPTQQSELRTFMVQQDVKHEDWKCAKLHLPVSLYKKVLLILHDGVLPHMSKPTLMIDFLTAAYDVGGAISLLALNGLFILIHQHNLDYPDFYQKLYNLLEPSVFHVKYRARFFHLANIFLSSSHLPGYLVAAFIKRLARLALTAPPPALLMVLPFIYNLIRRHPSCRVLIHRPGSEPDPVEDPYVMHEEEPGQCGALDSSLWEVKTLQRHFHPDVSKVSQLINTQLSEQEDDIDETLQTSTYELMDRDLKTELKTVPLEFEMASSLLKGDVLGRHFSLS